MIFTKDAIVKILQDPKGITEHNGRQIKNRKLIYRMLQALYQRQTAFETETKTTVEDNGIGFNGFDAGFLSDVAERSKQYKDLSILQAEKVAKRLIKYASQLESIAMAKQQVNLIICGYCRRYGHAQIDCKEYKEREMGKQLPLTSVQNYPD